MTKKRFFSIFGAYILILLAWYMFIYIPQVKNLEKINIQLGEISRKVTMARRAQINLNNIKEHFKKEQDRLKREKEKFIKKTDLDKVTYKLRELADRYNLKMTEFSPGFKDYFSDQNSEIVPLSLSIAFTGEFLRIGKFVEKWQDLPFYLVPEEITLHRLDKYGHKIQAVVEAKLYTWNN